ncbi:MAG: exopolysaccharide biosynthesis polyprenyl glycosylphosphotransferase [Clostridiales bacterium]|nr:exopolysaccharide biosynthesis polyprenyl glycosylphosphotransferase [Clostridiales bacterium]
MRFSHRFSPAHAFKIIYFFVVILLVNLSYVWTFYLLSATHITPISAENFKAYVALIPAISISSLILCDTFHLSRFFRKKPGTILSQTVWFVIVQTMVTTTAKDMLLQRAFPRSVLIFSIIIMFAMLSLWSGLCLHLSHKFYEKNRLVIIGGSLTSARLIRDKIMPLLHHYDLELTDTLIYSDRIGIRNAIMDQSEVFICPDVPDETKSEIILQCARKNTVAYMVPQYYEIALFQSRIINFDDLMVFLVDRMSLKFEQRILKRVLDIILSLLALIITSPFLLISAILIKCTSKGKVIYRQERLTIDKKSYFIYKLRTMYSDAEKKTGPVISGANDPRVTPIGKFLRRSKLDEVPQFINVLKGEMSVVGPRSERPDFVQKFESEIPAYDQRFAVKAGITGLAQVVGSYDTTPQDKLRYDLLYIKNYSVLEDFKIILHTFRVIFTPKLYKRSFHENMEQFAPSATRDEIRASRKKRKEQASEKSSSDDTFSI